MTATVHAGSVRCLPAVRVVRECRGRKAAWMLVRSFITVLFAYFGNHFFGGLHSYA